MNKFVTDKLMDLFNNPELMETGGGHNEKGVDFQRYWTILRIIELEKQGADDYLILREALQDVAELDSCSEPKSMKLYQLKKRDRKEWTWNELTFLSQPSNKQKQSKSTSKQKSNPTKPKLFKESPLGKLFLSFAAVTQLDVEARFISNRGADIPLNNSGNTATSTATALACIDSGYQDLIATEMEAISSNDVATKAISRIFFEKTSLEIDSLRTHITGYMCEFLEGRSPRHAGQAGSFVDALMVGIASLAKTDKCHSFEELCKRQGYTRKQFIDACADLETIPDIIELLNDWLIQLQNEKYSLMEITAIRMSACSLYQKQMMGNFLDWDKHLINKCDEFLLKNGIKSEISGIMDLAYDTLKNEFPNLKKSDIQAQFLLRAITKCVDQI